MGIFQIHWQQDRMNDDKPTELIESQDINSIDQMTEWVADVRRRFPEGREGMQLLICNPTSKHFVVNSENPQN